MNIKKPFSFLSLIVVGALVFTSCAELEVENTNDPTKEAVESAAENQTKLLAGGFYDLATGLVSSWAVQPHMIADQNTSTNNFRNFWDFTDEPRLRLNNTTSYSSSAVFSTFYGNFNSAVSTANIFINNIVNDGLVVRDAQGNDVTDAILAQAYFLRGTARGYLGLMYDQAFLIDENFVIGEDTPQFVPYGQMIDAAVSDLDEAINLASGATTFTFSAMPNPADSWNADEFVEIVNSFAARILAGEARTAAEAANTDWSAVLGYAQNGIGGSNATSGLGQFSNANIGSSGEFANYFNDWANFAVACQSAAITSCAGYNPTDVKVIHMMDTSYPTEYPAAEANGQNASLAPATTSDPRIGYFFYTTNAGFLNSSRNANLYSNYFSARFFAGNDWWPAEYRVTLFTDTETQLLEAEAELWLSQTGNAATILSGTPAGNGETTIGWSLPSIQNGYLTDASLSGGYTFTGTESLAEMQFALLREYSVEIDSYGGVGVPWFFMRRHDMLQIGSATMFPVPGGELEILGLDNYTFGGPSFAGEVGTASGSNSWKNLAASAGLKAAKVNSEAQAGAIMKDESGIDARSIAADAKQKGARDY